MSMAMQTFPQTTSHFLECLETNTLDTVDSELNVCEHDLMKSIAGESAASHASYSQNGIGTYIIICSIVVVLDVACCFGKNSLMSHVCNQSCQ